MSSPERTLHGFYTKFSVKFYMLPIRLLTQYRKILCAKMKIACKFARGFDIMEMVGQGRLAERPNAAVLKTVDGQLSGGSNPSPSAILQAAGHNSAPPLGVYMGEGEGFEGGGDCGSNRFAGELWGNRKACRKLHSTVYSLWGSPKKT